MKKYSFQLYAIWSSKTVRRDVLTLLSFVILCVAVNLPAYLHVVSDAARLNTLSLDEWVYSGFLDGEFYKQVLGSHFYNIITLKDWWGYGSIFWYAYGLIGLPAELLGSFSSKIISFRIFSAVWEGVALFFIYKIILELRGKYTNAVLGALVILAMPGFYFYFKAFSAEFMTSALAMASVYYLVKDNFRCQRSYFISIFLLGLTIGVKVSIITFVPWYGIYVCVVCWRSKKLFSEFFRTTLLTICICIVGFIVANPYLAVLGRSGLNHYYTLLQQNVADNATNHGNSIIGLDYHQWYQKVVQPEYFPSAVILLALLAYGIVILYEAKHKRYQTALLATLSSSYIAYIIFTVHKLWPWYLFPGMSLALIGLFILPFNQIVFFRKRTWLEPALLITLMLSLFIVNFSTITEKYNDNAQKENSSDFLAKISAQEQFDQWLRVNYLHDIVIIKSTYIYFNETPFQNITVVPIMGTLNDSYISLYTPQLLLVEKNFGFMKPNSEISSWISYPSLVAERNFFQQLTTTGAVIDGQTYQYNQVLETNDFFVYERN